MPLSNTPRGFMIFFGVSELSKESSFFVLFLRSCLTDKAIHARVSKGRTNMSNAKLITAAAVCDLLDVTLPDSITKAIELRTTGLEFTPESIADLLLWAARDAQRAKRLGQEIASSK
jgi:hypothetical protein